MTQFLLFYDNGSNGYLLCNKWPQRDCASVNSPATMADSVIDPPLESLVNPYLILDEAAS
jgi:hypothetical protein